MKIVIGLFFFLVSSIQAQVTYYEHIQPIIVEHCISCHADGKIGPMVLDNYENVSSFANMIEFVTSYKIMPPWRANQKHRDLSISKHLSDDELNAIRNWIADGLLEGKENSKSINESHIGDQDSVNAIPLKCDNLESKTATFKVREPFAHEGDYKMHQRVFVIPTLLDRDIYVSKIEFVPANKRIVMGCDIAVDSSRIGRKYDAMDPRSGYANVTGVAFRPETLSWYSWSPDDIQVPMKGYKRLAAESDLLLHIQYGPSAKTQIDQSEIILTYSEVRPTEPEIVSKVLIDTSSLSLPFLIPSDRVKHMRGAYEFEKDVVLSAIRPYGQLICEKWEVLLLHIDGRSSTLLEIDDWQFKWQRKYSFVTPLEVAKGSKIIAKATYNNTEENIDIPILPTKNVTYGEGLNQELYLVSFDYTIVNESEDSNN